MAITRTFKALSLILLSPLLAGKALASETRIATTTIDGVSEVHQYSQSEHRSETKATRRDHRQVSNHNHGLWFFDVSIGFTTDHDYDGHYSAFTISLDLETDLSPTSVYAVFYLVDGYGTRLEYAVTSDFVVSGYNSDDAIFIETRLDSGYRSDYYDHYIEIYDAYSHSLLLHYGPENNHHFHHLPFESHYWDTRGGSYASVSLSFGGAGSLSFAPLLLLTCLITVAARRRHSQNR